MPPAAPGLADADPATLVAHLVHQRRFALALALLARIEHGAAQQSARERAADLRLTVLEQRLAQLFPATGSDAEPAWQAIAHAAEADRLA